MVESEKKNIRIVVISDTHTKHYKMTIPDGDILIHAGDFTYGGKTAEIRGFIDFLKF